MSTSKPSRFASLEAGYKFEVWWDSPPINRDKTDRDKSREESLDAFFTQTGLQWDSIKYNKQPDLDEFFSVLGPGQEYLKDWFMVGFYTNYLAEKCTNGFRFEDIVWDIMKEYQKRLSALELAPDEIDKILSLYRQMGSNDRYPNHPLYKAMEYLEYFAKREDKKMPTSQVSISGGTFIGSTVGGVANTMQVYVQQLKIDEYASPEEKALKMALAHLRQSIEDTNDLSEVKKNTAATALALLTDQISQPQDKQDANAKKSYWSLLVETVSVSSGLVAITTNIGKIIGLL